MIKKNNHIILPSVIRFIGSVNNTDKSKYWIIKKMITEKRAGKHEIYWGCHSCNLDPNHKGKCLCNCGAIPDSSSMFWGDDFKGFTEREKKIRAYCMGQLDKSYMSEVVGDLKGTLINGEYKRWARIGTRRVRPKRRQKKK